MFQLPVQSNIAVDQAVLRILRDAQLLDEISALLAVGKELEVEVRQNKLTGEGGIFLKGQFLPAKLPEGSQPGDKLSVRVVKNTDALILQILPQASPSPAKLASTITIDNLIRGVLSDNQLATLRQLPRLLSPEAQPAFPLPGPLPGQAQPAADELFSEPPSAVADTLAKIVRSRLFVAEGELAAPKGLPETLARFSTDKVLAGVAEAKRSLERLSGDGRAELRLGVLSAIDEQLSELLQALGPGPAGDPFAGQAARVPGESLASSLKLALAVSRYAQEAGNLRIVDRLARDLGGAVAKNSPLSFLFEALLNLQSSRLPTESQADRDLATLVKELITDLAQHRDGKAEVDLKDTLSKHKNQIRDKFGDTGARLRDEQSVRAAAQAMKGLEGLAEAQDILNRVNPVVQALGEPALVLIPALVQGFLSRWEIVVPPHVPEEEDLEGEGEGGSRESFQRLAMVVNLPALGDIRVDLAHRSKELLLNLTLGSSEGAAFVASQLPKLEGRLRELGFERASLAAVKGEVSEVRPGWYRDLVKQGVVA